MEYVLVTTQFGNNPSDGQHTHLLEYYVGKTYTVQGEKYPSTSSLISNAKKYSSKKRAEHAKEALESKVDHEFMVMDVK